MNLIGDGLHNFTNRVIIAISFAVDINLGIATTIAIIFHEIPQEISDFGVLVYAGLSRMKALFYNFLVALTAIFGAFVGYVLSTQIIAIKPILLVITAGGFIYIATSDLISELNRENKLIKFLISFVFFSVEHWIDVFFKNNFYLEKDCYV